MSDVIDAARAWMKTIPNYAIGKQNVLDALDYTESLEKRLAGGVRGTVSNVDCPPGREYHNQLSAQITVKTTGEKMVKQGEHVLIFPATSTEGEG